MSDAPYVCNPVAHPPQVWLSMNDPSLRGRPLGTGLDGSAIWVVIGEVPGGCVVRKDNWSGLREDIAFLVKCGARYWAPIETPCMPPNT